MLNQETILTFWIASTLLALAPGPDNIFVLTQSAVHGKRAGIITTLGVLTGVLVHTCAVAFGIAAIFQTSEMAFAVLKYVGAVYLLYLTWKSFRAEGQVIESDGEGQVKLRKLYVRGIIMNVTNPKVSIFFLAFLPQFADPKRGSMVVQFLELGGVFILAGLLIFFMISFLAGSLGQWMNKSPRAQSTLNKVAVGIPELAGAFGDQCRIFIQKGDVPRNIQAFGKRFDLDMIIQRLEDFGNRRLDGSGLFLGFKKSVDEAADLLVGEGIFIAGHAEVGDAELNVA